jgi:hypothetical protein
MHSIQEVRILLKYVGTDVLTPVVMESPLFWNLMPCSPWKDNRCFGERTAPVIRIKEQVKQETSKRTLKVEVIYSPKR